jgi:hypothetical protein
MHYQVKEFTVVLDAIELYYHQDLMPETKNALIDLDNQVAGMSNLLSNCLLTGYTNFN